MRMAPRMANVSPYCLGYLFEVSSSSSGTDRTATVPGAGSPAAAAADGDAAAGCCCAAGVVVDVETVVTNDEGRRKKAASAIATIATAAAAIIPPAPEPRWFTAPISPPPSALPPSAFPPFVIACTVHEESAAPHFGFPFPNLYPLHFSVLGRDAFRYLDNHSPQRTPSMLCFGHA